MCGICGAFALTGTLDPAVRAALPAMTDSLRHRGPDGGGEFVDDAVALGHRRLAIIDRSGGHQPMVNEAGTHWIVFNGEVYNHKQIREDLRQRGYRFRTTSDTEAILLAYEEWGHEAVERLEGMFAFAIYDRRRRELFAARDRLGKKPFFFAELSGVLHFGSEIKALRASPYWDGTIDWSGLEGYLSLGYVLAPNTIYRHVKKLEPGHWLRAGASGVRTEQYWDVRRFDDDPRDEASLVGDLENTLGAAVRERLESEVPIGAFLSGGIDSGLVVSFMAEALGPGVVTTSVGFDESQHNELGAAGIAAARFATRHHEEVVVPALDDLLDPIAGGFDEPFADASAIPTFCVSRMAKRHVTVALTGDGGDETFGGYDFRYVPHALEGRLRPLLPGRPGRWLAARLGANWPRSRWLPRPLRLGRLIENLARDPATAYFIDLCFLKPWDAQALLRSTARDPRESAVYGAVTSAYRSCPSASDLQRAQYADLKVYLPNDPLVKVDRMSMAHGLEIRSPLLDRRVVEFAFRIPTERKFSLFTSKPLLRSLASRRLPGELVHLPKRGFTSPIGTWLAGPYAQRFEDDVLGPGAIVRDLVDVTLVRRLAGEHQAGTADHSYTLWALWMLERWHRTVDRQPTVVNSGGSASMVGRAAELVKETL